MSIKKTIKPLLILIIGVGVIFFAVKMFTAKKPKKDLTIAPKQKLPLVQIVDIKKETFEDTVSLTGTIKGSREIDLKFSVEGRIEKFNFKEGDIVKKDSIIAVLNQDKAKLILEKKEIELANAREMYKMQGLSATRLKEAQLDYQIAKVDFDGTEIKALHDGVMGTKYVEEGQLVTPQDKIASFISVDKTILETGIIERDVNKIKVGHKARIKVDRYPNKIFKGMVSIISPKLEGSSRTLTTKINIEPGKVNLLPGMFARAEVVIFKRENVFTIKGTALVKESGMYYVYIIDKENKLYKKQIDNIYSNEDLIVIEKELNEGDRIVLDPKPNFQEGLKVRIKR